MATNVAALPRRLFARPEGLMLAVLSAAAVTLVAAAVIGGRTAESATGPAGVAGPVTTEETDSVEYDDLIEGPAVGPEATKGSEETATAGTAGPAAAAQPGVSIERESAVGATRVGVFNDHFEVAVHAPMTFDGVPLNLAEDPIIGLKGYFTYVNRNGGVNGLKARLFLEDDRYTTAGGRQVADKIVGEIKPFIIEGTLGIDQIEKVARAAKAQGIPYMAGGGPEPEYKDVGMYQIISNYDQYAEMVAQFICKYGAKYVGGTTRNDVRLGTTTLNTPNILPVEKRLVKKLSDRNCVREPVDSNARGTIDKPTEQRSYVAQSVDLRNSYGGQGANLLVPLQDPVSTSRQTLEWCGNYCPKWTIANFAHDSDTALALFQGKWTGMRVMSGGCYYHPSGGGKPYDAGLCAKMGEAHKQWVSLGQVEYDQNAGGCKGTPSCDYNYQEGTAQSEGWTRDGSGGAAGYQLTYFWHGAMASIGTDPTREKFTAALNAYDGYSNLVTSPITFAGSSNHMIGATKFVLLEGMQNLKYRQVTEITPGLVDHF